MEPKILDAKPPEIATLIRAATALERLVDVIQGLNAEGRIVWGIRDQGEFELKIAAKVAVDIRALIQAKR